jgi:hypothetical protein
MINILPKGKRAYKDVRGLGYEEIEIDGQVGLIQSGYAKYQPKRDLVRAAIEIADFVAKDKYWPDTVQVASDFSPGCLETEDNSALEKEMGAINACVILHADFDPGIPPESRHQSFQMDLVETIDETSASSLLRIAKDKIKKLKNTAMLALAVENLFCLITARSPWAGIESYETSEKLTRFSMGLSEILHRNTE